MKRDKIVYGALLCGVVLLCNSCMLGRRQIKSPELELPATVVAGATDSLTMADMAWWNVYSDSTLTALIERTLERNKDMLAASARVRRMRALAAWRAPTSCRRYRGSWRPIPSTTITTERQRRMTPNSTPRSRWRGSSICGAIALGQPEGRGRVPGYGRCAARVADDARGRSGRPPIMNWWRSIRS